MKKINAIFICLMIVFCIGCKSNEDNTFVVSTILPYSGTGAAVGENLKQSIDLCAEKWNEKGGLLGKKIIIDHNDSRGESKYGQIIANKLCLSTKPNVVISGITGVVMSAQPILEKNKIISQCMVTTDQIFESSPQYTLRNYISSAKSCKYFLEMLQKVFGTNKFILFYENTEFGMGYLDNFNSLVNQQSTSIEGAVEFDQHSTDYRNIIKKQGVDSNSTVYIAAKYQALGRMVKQLRESGFTGSIISDAHLNSASALNIIGSQNENLYYIDVSQGISAMEIRNELETRYNKQIDDIALIAYNGLDVLLQYITDANTINNEVLMSKINGFSCESILGVTKIDNYDFSLNLKLQKID